MALREFEDEQGRTWRAWETIPSRAGHVQPDFASGWVCFESGNDKRRLAPAPTGWDQQPAERLRIMLRAAVAATARSNQGNDPASP